MSVLDESNKIRLSLIDAVRRDLIGPTTGGPYVETYKERFKLSDTDEVFVGQGGGDKPSSRYVAGKLYSYFHERAQDAGNRANENDPARRTGGVEDETEELPETIRGTKRPQDGTSDDPIQQANATDRSALGLTFRVPKDSKIQVKLHCGIYQLQSEGIDMLKLGEGNKVEPSGAQAKEWWRRKELLFPWDWQPGQPAKPEVSEQPDSLHLVGFQITERGTEDGITTYSLTATNMTPVSDASGAEQLYQCVMEVTTDKEFSPLKERTHRKRDEDQELMDLLYRKNTIHGMGHGCAAVWDKDPGGRVTKLRTEFLPVHSIPAVVPKEADADMDLAMWDLANGDDAQIKKLLDSLVKGYDGWITEILKPEAAKLGEEYREAASRNQKECERTLERMKVGIKLLMKEENAMQCFKWMNHAMLWQQQRSKVGQRDWVGNGVAPVPKGERGADDDHFRSLEEYHNAKLTNGRWRPFQLAFVLMNIPAMWEPGHTDRDMVDLIWFPTGGGKTEAYLGLAAFTVFARRILNKGGHRYGTAILMRYTLRLLTAQQFERASSLILACELVRKQNIRLLKDEPFSIGLWVGSGNTPNWNKDAVNDHAKGKYSFVLLKCPCCGARFGKRVVPGAGRRGGGGQGALKGVRHKNSEVVFDCFNPACEFHGPDHQLPIYVVNEQVYNHTPTLVVGTVDMFAQTPWISQKDNNEFVSRLFGFRGEGEQLHRIKPPDLIIQDELHLISGPLGSMVGMYETLIQELCTDRGYYTAPFHPVPADDRALYVAVPPKIVASSATITRAADQIRGLYGKVGNNALQVFPPQGLDIGETWFSKVETDPLDKEQPRLHKNGRWYVGMCPVATGQTTVYRTYGAVIAERHQEVLVANTPEHKDALDYYWTLMGYYNSTKELGHSMTMMSNNLPEYLKRKAARDLIPGLTDRADQLRAMEMYGQVDADEIAVRLKLIENRGDGADGVDVCLATNMIATGLDVSRLGLMFIHGQPKTTAEYIQASSRVGRKYLDGPGLIFMHYSGHKPRDLSIFEHFTSYHERIYAQVEPTSVTSYSARVREKALHAVFYGLIRHYSKNMRSQRNNEGANLPALLDFVKKVITDRAVVVLQHDPNALAEAVSWLDELCRSLPNLAYFGDMGNATLRVNGRIPLTAMMVADKPVFIADAIRTYCLPTPNTMRSVDPDSNIDIINI